MIEELLQTERLLLRKWTGGDAGALFEICRDARVMRHIGNGQPFRRIEQAQQFICWVEAHQSEYGYSRLAVVENSTGEIIGSCGFAQLADSGEVELGYLFAHRVWGKGYATEAAQACLKYGFEHLNLPAVVALTAPSHRTSQKVVEKLGFMCRGNETFQNEINRIYVAVNSTTVKQQ